jgi:methylmalonyl-CoA carboxyltransferase large subunit
MPTETVDPAQLTEALAALRREVARLAERVAALEGVTARGPGPDARGQESLDHKPQTAAEPELSEELILVISAAVAAYLGKRPHIRQIRLLDSTSWAQQGRVTIQASHALSVHHARSSP